MDELREVDTLLVQQKKEWAEILTDIESKNRYAIVDPAGNQLAMAAEESSFWGRFFLKASRSFTIHILSSQGQKILRLDKSFT